MVRNKPAGDAFASNRRSPALLRRKREMELKAGQDGAELATSFGEMKLGSLPRSLSSTSRLTFLSCCLLDFSLISFIVSDDVDCGAVFITCQVSMSSKIL